MNPSAAEALERLVEGNARFVRGDARFPTGLGDLFIARLAGNVVSAEVMGTLQYAGVHLATPLFVVLRFLDSP